MRESLFNQRLKKRSKLKALSRRNPRPPKKTMRKHIPMHSLWTSRKSIRKTLCIQSLWTFLRVSHKESSQILTISRLQRQLMIQRGSWTVQAHLGRLSMGQLQLFLPPFYSFPRAFRHNLPRNQDWCRPQILLPPLFQEVFQNPFQSLLLLPSDIPEKQFSVQSVPSRQSTNTSRSIYQGMQETVGVCPEVRRTWRTNVRERSLRRTWRIWRFSKPAQQKQQQELNSSLLSWPLLVIVLKQRSLKKTLQQKCSPGRHHLPLDKYIFKIFEFFFYSFLLKTFFKIDNKIDFAQKKQKSTSEDFAEDLFS